MHRSTLLAILLAPLLAGCAVGPGYQRPAAFTATAYKEADNLPAWKYAQPGDLNKPESWWRLYEDGRLNALLGEVAQANQNIKVGEGRYRQALALTDSARSGLWPVLSLNAPVKRGIGASAVGTDNVTTSHRVTLDASWEVDLWGRLRSQVDSNAFAAEAGAADLAAVELAVQASFVQTYFQVRVLDVQQRLLDDTAQAYERSLQLTQNRYRVGVATRSDVAQAETQLKSTQALALDNRAQRAQLEHALAVLLGRAPVEFRLEPDFASNQGSASGANAALAFRVPIVPAGLPSNLLERRPDVAAAERRVAAANASIGAAQAAIFPSLTLTASSGFQSNQLSEWLTLPNRVWSLGPMFAASLFDGGLRRAQTNGAIAAYDAAVAAYRQTVLASLQEVEDNLATLAWLEQEAEVLDAAVRSARESEQEMLNRYNAGTTDYLSVVTVQTTALSIERNALTILGRRLTASAGLIKALGGSWDSPWQ